MALENTSLFSCGFPLGHNCYQLNIHANTILYPAHMGQHSFNYSLDKSNLHTNPLPINKIRELVSLEGRNAPDKTFCRALSGLAAKKEAEY